MSYRQLMRPTGVYDNSEFKDPVYQDYIEHHGILGMKWGVRRFQNEDGSLTDKGETRYSLGDRIHAYNVAKKRKENLEKARKSRMASAQALKDRQENLRKGKLSTKEMSLDELTEYQKRLTLEKSVSDLKKSTSRGYQFTESLKDSAVKGLSTAVQVTVQKVIGDYLTNKIGDAINASSTEDEPLVDTLAYKKKNSSKDKSSGNSEQTP